MTWVEVVAGAACEVVSSVVVWVVVVGSVVSQPVNVARATIARLMAMVIFIGEFGSAAPGAEGRERPTASLGQQGYFLSSIVVVVLDFFSMIAGAVGVTVVVLRTTTRLATMRSPTLV